MIVTYQKLRYLTAIVSHNNSFSNIMAAMSLANAFSGGVFLSLAFGHLLPHAIDELTSLHHGGSGQALPLGLSPATCACCMAAAGYLMVFLVERIVFDTENILQEVDQFLWSLGNTLLILIITKHG